jgi:RNA polymerase sigma factor (sigma-70 family)
MSRSKNPTINQLNDAYAKYQKTENIKDYNQVINFLEPAISAIYWGTGDFKNNKHIDFEDCKSAVIEKVLPKIQQREVEEKLSGYVSLSVNSVVIDAFRKKNSTQKFEKGYTQYVKTQRDFHEEPPIEREDNFDDRKESYQRVEKILKKTLPNKTTREIFLDAFFWEERGLDDKPEYKDLAEKHDLEVGAIKMRMKRAKAALKRAIGRSGGLEL